MVRGHAVTVALCIVGDQSHLFEQIVPARECNGIAGVVYPCCRKCPDLAVLVDPHDGDIVRAVLSGREWKPIVDVGELLFRL